MSHKLPVTEDEHKRACQALFRYCIRHHHIYQQPAKGSTVWSDDQTMSLSNGNGCVGKVRVYADGRMRGVEV